MSEKRKSAASANTPIPYHRPAIGPEEIQEVVSCLESGWLTTGPRVKRFEADFASYIGLDFALALNSCTAALHLALEAVGLKKGEIVIVPTMTFAATAEVVRYFDAIPVFADCLEDDFCVNPNAVAELCERIDAGRPVKGLSKRGGRIRAIIPVHFGGAPADIPAIAKIAKRVGAHLIEDCAHACPALYENCSGKMLKAGAEADIACYSFYANKAITTGEGGMAATNNPAFDERMRLMSLHGLSRDAWKRFTLGGSWRYEITDPGYKYNMPDLIAAIGIHQLKKADLFREKREKIAETYSALLENLSEIILPKARPGTINSWHIYPIRIKSGGRITRDEFIERLKDSGIGASVHYIPLHLHKYYREKYGLGEGDFPVSEKLGLECVSLPIYPDMSLSDVEKVAVSIKRIIAGGRIA